MTISSACPGPSAGRIRVRLLLFGAFRALADGPELTLEVPRGTTVSALRRHVGEALSRSRPSAETDALVEASAVAFDDGILLESHALGEGVDEVRAAILPPVCGG